MHRKQSRGILHGDGASYTCLARAFWHSHTMEVLHTWDGDPDERASRNTTACCACGRTSEGRKMSKKVAIAKNHHQTRYLQMLVSTILSSSHSSVTRCGLIRTPDSPSAIAKTRQKKHLLFVPEVLLQT